ELHLPPRHCERSEAIHRAAQRMDGLLRSARNDGGESPAHSRFAPHAVQWQNYSQVKTKAAAQSCTGGPMTNSQAAPGIVGPFAGLDVPWLLRMRAESRRNHPFLIWAPFEGPARSWSYGEFHERVGALSAGLVKRGIKPGEYVLT